MSMKEVDAWIIRNPIKCTTQGMYDFEYDEKGDGFHHIQPDCEINFNPVEQDQILAIIKIDYSVPAYHLCNQPPCLISVSVNDILIETIRILDEKRRTAVIAIHSPILNNYGGGGGYKITFHTDGFYNPFNAGRGSDDRNLALSVHSIYIGFNYPSLCLYELDLGDIPQYKGSGEFDGVLIELTSHCNLHCEFCPSDSLKRKKQNMKHEYVLNILSELRDRNMRIMFHVMGEPLLNKYLPIYLSVCDEYNINVHLISNVTLLNDEKLNEILSHKSLSCIELSLQTVSEEDFVKRGSGLSFKEYLKTLENIVFNRNRILRDVKILICVMNDYNCYHDKLWGVFSEEKLNAFLDLTDVWKEKLINQGAFKREELDDKELLPGHGVPKRQAYYTTRSHIPHGFFKDSEYGTLSYEFAPNLVVFVKYFGTFGANDRFLEKLSSRPGYPYNISIKESRNPRPCGLARNIAVLSNGEITCCCLDVEGELSLGNYENISLLDAIASPLRNLVHQHPDYFSTCRRCRGELVFTKKELL